MASSNVTNVISNMMNASGDQIVVQKIIEQEKVNMNYIFEVENSLTKRRPIYVRKIDSQLDLGGMFYL